MVTACLVGVVKWNQEGVDLILDKFNVLLDLLEEITLSDILSKALLVLEKLNLDVFTIF